MVPTPFPCSQCGESICHCPRTPPPTPPAEPKEPGK